MDHETLGQVKAASGILKPCPSWLIKAGLLDWLGSVANASLKEILKKLVVKPLLKNSLGIDRGELLQAFVQHLMLRQTIPGGSESN